jgi:hypothetical protein
MAEGVVGTAAADPLPTSGGGDTILKPASDD